jgi:hypothetical protein
MRWTISPCWLLALAVLQSCHRAEIDIDRLVERAPDGAQGGEAGAEASAGAPSESRGGSGGEPNEASAGAGPVDSRDDIAALLCRDPLDSVQQECLLLDAHACGVARGGWDGCAGGCQVCRAELLDYPHYLDWHPCCEMAECSEGSVGVCHEHCPRPTVRDKFKPCHDD